MKKSVHMTIYPIRSIEHNLNKQKESIYKIISNNNLLSQQLGILVDSLSLTSQSKHGLITE